MDKQDNLENTEPTLEKWKELYNAATKIQGLSPWSVLWDTDIIMLEIPENKEPIYCSILGRGDMCYGVIMYIGQKGLKSFLNIQNCGEFEHEFVTCLEQLCIACNFGDREELSPKERDIIKRLKLRFRGRGKWVFFRRLDPGFYPWYISENDADIATSALNHLHEAVTAILNGKVQVRFDAEEVLRRKYCEQKGEWVNEPYKISFELDEEQPLYIVDDELLLARVKKVKKTRKSLEMEALYLPTPIQEDRNERPYLPIFGLLMDVDSEMIVGQFTLQNDNELAKHIIQMLTDYISRFGRPDTVYVRDERMLRYVGDFCKKTEINIVSNRGLPLVNQFLDEMLQMV